VPLHGSALYAAFSGVGWSTSRMPYPEGRSGRLCADRGPDRGPPIAAIARSHTNSRTRFEGSREVSIVAMSASTFHHRR
jgi:hypothetical protein